MDRFGHRRESHHRFGGLPPFYKGGKETVRLCPPARYRLILRVLLREGRGERTEGRKVIFASTVFTSARSEGREERADGRFLPSPLLTSARSEGRRFLSAICPLTSALSSGAVAQLGERLPCTQEVRSSSLLGSTTGEAPVPFREDQSGRWESNYPAVESRWVSDERTKRIEQRPGCMGDLRSSTREPTSGFHAKTHRYPEPKVFACREAERKRRTIKKQKVVRESCKTQRATTD